MNLLGNPTLSYVPQIQTPSKKTIKIRSCNLISMTHKARRRYFVEFCFWAFFVLAFRYWFMLILGVICMTCTRSWFHMQMLGHGRRPLWRTEEYWVREMKIFQTVWLFYNTTLFTPWALAALKSFWILMWIMPLLMCTALKEVVKLHIMVLVRWDSSKFSLFTCCLINVCSIWCVYTLEYYVLWFDFVIDGKVIGLKKRKCKLFNEWKSQFCYLINVCEDWDAFRFMHRIDKSLP